MRQFNVRVKDQPGSLARVCEIISATGINIKAISNEQLGDGNARIRIVTNDEKSTKIAFEKAHLSCTSDEILALKLEDRPGELLKVARLLGDAGNNINSIYILGKENDKTVVAIAPEDTLAARKLLIDYL